jgi:hypothetical protein
MNSLIRYVGKLIRRQDAGSDRAKRGNVSDLPSALDGTFKVRLNKHPEYPTIELFGNRLAAQQHAAQMGPPWVPIAFACGYILTNGWSFCDVKGPLATFCPIPYEALDEVRVLVTWLKHDQIPAGRLPEEIGSALKHLAPSLTQAAFEGLCYCTLLRVGYPLPTGAKDDWLTTPAWALRLPGHQIKASKTGQTLNP